MVNGVLHFPGLIVKDSYWRWPQRNLAGNAIDVLTLVSIWRNFTKARMIAMLTAIAHSLFTAEESTATPCSEKAMGAWRGPIWSELEAARSGLPFHTYLLNPLWFMNSQMRPIQV